jgi:hypothetical protein
VATTATATASNKAKKTKPLPVKTHIMFKHGVPPSIAKIQKVNKPRRIIPDDKEYIPDGQQPSSTDVVGGRGGRR